MLIVMHDVSRKQRWLSRGCFLCLIALGCAFLGCRGTSDATSKGSKPEGAGVDDSGGKSRPQLFRDVTLESGIDFVHQPVDHNEPFFMPRSVGSGGAFFDYDGDGLLDIYLLQNAGPDSDLTNRLYRQTADGFQDVSADSGLDVPGLGMGVACGDINNDGRVDVLLNEFGRARLFQNRSEGTVARFEEITESSGLDNRMWGTSTCFVDYDRDGWLDIVLVNYVNYDPSRWCADGGGRQDFCGPDAFPGRVTKLFRNEGRGDSVRFEDVTVSSGLSTRPGPGLGIFCADFDGDRWPDIFIANDGKPNHLWINQQDGTFKEEAISRGLAYNSMGKTEADMGIAIGDVDGDGMFDIFITHLSDETHTLWTQGPRGVFTDRTATSGLTATEWRGTGFGTVMMDVDNDGDLDLFLANGRVTRETGPLPQFADGLPEFWQPYAQRDQVLLNRDKRFIDASLENDALCQFAAVSRGMATADYNNDGRKDLLVTHIAGPPRLLLNVCSEAGHWLTVRAIDPTLNRDAYGAEVYVRAGEQQWMRWINPGYSFLCSNDPRAHFGLGESANVDEIRVIWPDGAEERFAGGSIDREVTLRRGEGQMVNR